MLKKMKIKKNVTVLSLIAILFLSVGCDSSLQNYDVSENGNVCRSVVSINQNEESFTAEDLVGTWEGTVRYYSDNDCPVRYTFNSDGTCSAVTAIQTVLESLEDYAVLYYYEGTYSVCDNVLTTKFDNTKFSFSNGNFWHDFGYKYEVAEPYFRWLEYKGLDVVDVLTDVKIVGVNANECMFENDEDFICLKMAGNQKAAIKGFWEKSSDNIIQRYLFNSDGTYELADISIRDKFVSCFYERGKYDVVLGCLQLYADFESADYYRWYKENSYRRENSSFFAQKLFIDSEGKLLGEFTKKRGNDISY